MNASTSEIIWSLDLIHISFQIFQRLRQFCISTPNKTKMASPRYVFIKGGRFYRRHNAPLSHWLVVCYDKIAFMHIMHVGALEVPVVVVVEILVV